MRIAIIHPNEKAKWSEPITWDGLHAALKIIGRKHQVDWCLAGDEPDDSYDWIIPWGVGSEPFNNTIERYKGRKALLCAGHPQDTANFEKFEAIFVESPDMRRQILHPKVVLAFGTDTEFFKPQEEEKIFDVFYPASYSSWKRQDLFAQATKGLKALTCGTVQADGIDLFKQCEQSYAIAGPVPTAIVAKLYNMSKVVCITAWHGSERTVLEAMSTNIPLVITRDNVLACSLGNGEVIQVDPNPESIQEGVNRALRRIVRTRDFIIKNYSQGEYSRKILEVLES